MKVVEPIRRAAPTKRTTAPVVSEDEDTGAAEAAERAERAADRAEKAADDAKDSADDAKPDPGTVDPTPPISGPVGPVWCDTHPNSSVCQTGTPAPASEPDAQ